jgi:hypothetical protein
MESPGVSMVKIPGPTDFLGARVETEVDDGGGTWLWRRDLVEGAGGGGIDVLIEDGWVWKRVTSL